MLCVVVVVGRLIVCLFSCICTQWAHRDSHPDNYCSVKPWSTRPTNVHARVLVLALHLLLPIQRIMASELFVMLRKEKRTRARQPVNQVAIHSSSQSPRILQNRACRRFHGDQVRRPRHDIFPHIVVLHTCDSHVRSIVLHTCDSRQMLPAS